MNTMKIQSKGYKINLSRKTAKRRGPSRIYIFILIIDDIYLHWIGLKSTPLQKYFERIYLCYKTNVTI